MHDYELAISNVLPPLVVLLVGILTTKLKIYPTDEIHLLTTLVCYASLPVSLLYMTGWVQLSRDSLVAVITYVVVVIVYAVMGALFFLKDMQMGMLLAIDNIAVLQGLFFPGNCQFIYQSVIMLTEPIFMFYLDKQTQMRNAIEELKVGPEPPETEEKPALLEQEEEHHADLQKQPKVISIWWRMFLNCRFICAVLSLVILLLPVTKPKLPYCITQSFTYLAKMSAPLAFVSYGMGFYKIIDQAKLGKVNNLLGLTIKLIIVSIIKQLIFPVICAAILKRIVSGDVAAEIAKVLSYGTGVWGFAFSLLSAEKFLFQFGFAIFIGVIMSYVGFIAAGYVATS